MSAMLKKSIILIRLLATVFISINTVARDLDDDSSMEDTSSVSVDSEEEVVPVGTQTVEETEIEE